MKAEDTDQAPHLNLETADGEHPQTRNELITKVLLSDGKWYDIIKGSFKYYRYKLSSDRIIPYVQFKIPEQHEISPGGMPYTVAESTIQVFPATVAGWASDE